MKVKSTKYSQQINKNKNKKQTKKASNLRKKINPVVKKEVRPDGITEYTVKKIMTDDQIKKKIGRYFPEFRTFSDQCKFNNCLHVDEPSCSVKNAISMKLVSSSRYRSYLQLLDDNKIYRNSWGC